MPILGGWGEGKDAVFYQQGRGLVSLVAASF